MTDLKETLWTRLDDVRAAMLDAGGGRFVPMSPYADRDEGAIWFITAEGTDVAYAAEAGAHASLLIAESGANLYADIDGDLSAVKDDAKLRELWNPIASTWFEEGIDDPDIRLVKMTPRKAEMWATDGAAGFLYEIAKAKLTDGQPDMGTHGTVTF